MLTVVRTRSLPRLALLASYRPSFGNHASVFTFPRVSSPLNMIMKLCFSARFSVQASNESNQRTYQVVVAATRDMGIGRDEKLPWRLASDLKFFKELTLSTSDPSKKNAVIMGRKTWESIPSCYRPLPGRFNIVLTRSRCFDADHVLTCQSISSALQLLAKDSYALAVEKVFVIGGGQILRDMLNAPRCDAIHITEIETSIECDTFAPGIDPSLFQLWYLSPTLVENNVRYSFATYVRERNSLVGTHVDKFEVENFSFLPKMILGRHEEYQYLRLLKDAISNDNKKIEHRRMGFNLQRMFPLLTTKKIPWQGVVGEVLKFIAGSRSAKLSDVIEKIKDRTDEKKINLSPWNPSGKKTAETFSQFYIADGGLCCQLYHQSADIILEAPFNIASYSLLTCIIAHVCDLAPGHLIYVLEDAQVSAAYIRPVQEQLMRHPKPFPILKLNLQKKDIDSFEPSDIELSGYDPCPDMDMRTAM